MSNKEEIRKNKEICNKILTINPKIRYVGIEFEPSKIESCEKEVNDALSQGFEPIRDFETPRGLVMVLGLWKQD